MPRDNTRAAYAGGRVTPQRRIIATVAAAMPGAFSVDELADAVRADDPAIGTATVYRAVGALEDSGYLERVGERDGAALFLRCAHAEHHHHLICDSCGRVAPARCPVSTEALAEAHEAGFTVTRHEVTLYGLCPACASEGA